MDIGKIGTFSPYISWNSFLLEKNHLNYDKRVLSLCRELELTATATANTVSLTTSEENNI